MTVFWNNDIVGWHFFKKIIVVKDTPAPWYTEEGILVISIYDFLLNEDSLDL